MKSGHVDLFCLLTDSYTKCFTVNFECNNMVSSVNLLTVSFVLFSSSLASNDVASIDHV